MLLPLLTTKLNIPPVSPHLVYRERLMERLTEGLERKLTIISAPAGFGKTTLLSQWIADAAHRPERVIWLSLDRRDNDPHRFWRYFIAAVKSLESANGF